jgi:hypothetical protein
VVTVNEVLTTENDPSVAVTVKPLPPTLMLQFANVNTPLFSIPVQVDDKTAPFVPLPAVMARVMTE